MSAEQAPAAPDVISLALASLYAARSTEEPDIAAFYLATARRAIDQLDEQLKKLRLSLTTREAEFVRRGKAFSAGSESETSRRSPR